MSEAKAKEKKPAEQVSEAELRGDERATVNALNAQPKVRIKLYQVPKDSSDKPLPDETVAVNGYVYQIQRGHAVEVPQTVSDILEDTGRL